MDWYAEVKKHHKMQEIVVADDGVIRFRQNAIVNFLLEAGPFDLNQISMMGFSRADYTQLMQLIGYSVSGYGELSTSPSKLVRRADRKACELTDGPCWCGDDCDGQS